MPVVTRRFVALLVLFSLPAVAQAQRHRLTFENLPGEIHLTGFLGTEDVVILATNDTQMVVDVEWNEAHGLGTFRNVHFRWQGSDTLATLKLTSSVWTETARSGGRAILDFLDDGQKRIAVGNHPGLFDAAFESASVSDNVTHQGARSAGGGTFLLEVDSEGGSASVRFNGDHVTWNRSVDTGFRALKAHVVDDGLLHTGSVLHVPVGDADSDGDVDFQDFLALTGNFGGPGEWEDGSFDYDGLVRFDDFLALSANFGTGSRMATIPEPSSWVLLGIGGLLRKRRQVASAISSSAP